MLLSCRHVASKPKNYQPTKRKMNETEIKFFCLHIHLEFIHGFEISIMTSFRLSIGNVQGGSYLDN